MAFAARMVLMHINVKILSAVRSRPLTQVSFHVHYFASYFDIIVQLPDSEPRNCNNCKVV